MFMLISISPSKATMAVQRSTVMILVPGVYFTWLEYSGLLGSRIYTGEPSLLCLHLTTTVEPSGIMAGSLLSVSSMVHRYRLLFCLKFPRIRPFSSELSKRNFLGCIAPKSGILNLLTYRM